MAGANSILLYPIVASTAAATLVVAVGGTLVYRASGIGETAPTVIHQAAPASQSAAATDPEPQRELPAIKKIDLEMRLAEAPAVPASEADPARLTLIPTPPVSLQAEIAVAGGALAQNAAPAARLQRRAVPLQVASRMDSAALGATGQGTLELVPSPDPEPFQFELSIPKIDDGALSAVSDTTVALVTSAAMSAFDPFILRLDRQLKLQAEPVPVKPAVIHPGSLNIRESERTTPMQQISLHPEQKILQVPADSANP